VRRPSGFLCLSACLLLASPATAETAFRLQLLHGSDYESAFVDPVTLEPTALHYAQAAAALQRLGQVEGLATVHLAAGDLTLPGPWYQAAKDVPGLGAPGLGDIALFNALGLTANGTGNHEFDGGLDQFATMLAAARFPFVSVNLDFSRARTGPGVPPIRLGRDGGSVRENAGKVVRSAWIEAGGERIGIVGRSPADFFTLVRDPERTQPGLDFYGGHDPATKAPLVSAAGQVAEQVTLLRSQGIDKIILVDHAQDFAADPLLPGQLEGIDVIVSAGTTGVLANAPPRGPFDLLRPGALVSGPYPLRLAGSDGAPVLVVRSDEHFRTVGNLIVGFDGQGRISEIDPRSGQVATQPESLALLAALTGGEAAAPAGAGSVLATLAETASIRRLARPVATTTSLLEGARSEVRSRETSLGRLLAEAMLWNARQAGLDADLAFTNGGGIRDSIPAPQVTGFPVASALPFDNGLLVVEATAAQLYAALENGVGRVPALDGRFPQVAGLRMAFEPQRPALADAEAVTAGSRVRQASLLKADGTEEALVRDFRLLGPPDRRLRVVINDFMSKGGDGYRAFATARALGVLPLAQQEAFTAYLERGLQGKVEATDPPSDPAVRRE